MLAAIYSDFVLDRFGENLKLIKLKFSSLIVGKASDLESSSFFSDHAKYEIIAFERSRLWRKGYVFFKTGQKGTINSFKVMTVESSRAASQRY